MHAEETAFYASVRTRDAKDWDNHRDNHGKTMGKPWENGGFSHVLSLNKSGFFMGCPWEYSWNIHMNSMTPLSSTWGFT